MRRGEKRGGEKEEKMKGEKKGRWATEIRVLC